jgi:hypothetical protein
MSDEMLERAQPGVHFGEIETRLSTNQQAEVLRGLAQANALELLRRHPLGGIHLVARVEDADGSRITGKYVFNPDRHDYRHVYVSTDRPAGSYRQPFRVGRTYAVSNVGATPTDAMKRTLVHELAHHVAEVGGNEVRSLIVQSLRRAPRQRVITRYASERTEDYWAEIFTAYTFHPRLLQRHDPEGYNLVRAVRRQVGMPQ